MASESLRYKVLATATTLSVFGMLGISSYALKQRDENNRLRWEAALYTSKPVEMRLEFQTRGTLHRQGDSLYVLLGPTGINEHTFEFAGRQFTGEIQYKDRQFQIVAPARTSSKAPVDTTQVAGPH